jgi:rare lipoprotein A
MRDHALTAAHRTLPFGTKVRVTHSKSGKSVVVTIIDRGPFVRGRIIDLAPAAARLLGISGLAPVIIANGNPEPEQGLQEETSSPRER